MACSASVFTGQLKSQIAINLKELHQFLNRLKDGNSAKRYVITNPKANFTLLPTDQVPTIKVPKTKLDQAYVVLPFEWTHRRFSFIEGTLCFVGWRRVLNTYILS